MMSTFTNYRVDVIYSYKQGSDGRTKWFESNSLVPAHNRDEALYLAIKELEDVNVIGFLVRESYGVVHLGLPTRFKTQREARDAAEICRRCNNAARRALQPVRSFYRA